MIKFHHLKGSVAAVCQLQWVTETRTEISSGLLQVCVNICEMVLVAVDLKNQELLMQFKIC